LAEIVSAFGNDALTASGELDRRRMRERVFANPVDRRRLEAIVHPRVREILRAAVDACRAPYCIVAVPLLAENHAAYAWVDRILVVDVPREVQIERVMRRDNSSRESALRALDAQAGPAERLQLADDVVDNTASLAALTQAAQRLHERYLNTAARASA
jgi:dephospho-CoA kinase